MKGKEVRSACHVGGHGTLFEGDIRVTSAGHDDPEFTCGKQCLAHPLRELHNQVFLENAIPAARPVVLAAVSSVQRYDR